MQRAFTLIEIVIVIGLFAIMVLGIAQLYIVFGRVITMQSSSISVTLGGSAIVDTVRVAGLRCCVVQSHTFSGVSYNSGTTTAIFELPAIDASGAIIVGTFDYVGIYVSSTTVYRTVDAAVGSSRTSGTKVLTDSLGALTFTYDTASFPSVTSVIVDATTSAVVKGQTTQMHLRSHTYLRNL